MAITHFINRPKSQDRRGMAAVLKYVGLDRKTILDDGTKLVSGVNCVAQSAWREFMQTKLLYHKDDKVMFAIRFVCLQTDRDRHAGQADVGCRVSDCRKG